MILTRRRLLRCSAALAVAAFHPASRRWLLASESCPPGSIEIPELDGELFLEDPLLEAAGGDFGRIVSLRPRAVLQPGSVADVQRLILFARAHRLQVTAAGQAGDSHATFGQA